MKDSSIAIRATVRPVEQHPRNPAQRVGYYTSILATITGAIYFITLVSAAVVGELTFPPPSWLQTFGGMVSLLLCPLLVVLMASLHETTPSEKKLWSQISLAFTLLFAIAVSINRFTQFGAVRQSLAVGEVQAVKWFLPYDGRSVMFGLELLGWGWFLGIAMLATAPLFSGGGQQRWLRRMALLYAALGLTSAVAYLFGSPLSVVGFAGWGFVLYLFTAGLAVHLRKLSRDGDAP